MQTQTVQAALQAAGHFSANNPAVIADITKLITAYEGGRRPYYIYCAATGAKLGMSQQPVYEKRLELFGGNILKMFAEYKGRSAGSSPKPASAPKVFQPAQKTIIPARNKGESSYESFASKFDKDGEPIEQTIVIREGGKITKKDVRVLVD